MHTDSIERIEVREVNQTKKIGRETLMLSRVAMILKGLQLCGALTAFLSFFYSVRLPDVYHKAFLKLFGFSWTGIL